MHSPARNGIRSRNWAAASGERIWRGAPLGVPVVPLVSNTRPPASRGAGTGRSSLLAISSSSVGTPSAGRSVTQASARGISAGRPSASSVNSSSCTNAETPSRAATSTSAGRANPVFISSSLAPSLPAASIVSTAPRWSRASKAITEPGADTAVGERPGQGVGAQVELVEGQRTQLVDQAERLVVARRGDLAAPAIGP